MSLDACIEHIHQKCEFHKLYTRESLTLACNSLQSFKVHCKILFTFSYKQMELHYAKLLWDKQNVHVQLSLDCTLRLHRAWNVSSFLFDSAVYNVSTILRADAWHATNLHSSNLRRITEIAIWSVTLDIVNIGSREFIVPCLLVSKRSEDANNKEANRHGIASAATCSFVACVGHIYQSVNFTSFTHEKGWH